MDDMNSPAVEAPAQPAGPPSFRTEYRPDEGFALELRGLDDAQLFNADGTPQTITLLGNDSDVAVRARHSQSNRRLQSGQRLKLTSEGLESDGAVLPRQAGHHLEHHALAAGAGKDLPGGSDRHTATRPWPCSRSPSSPSSASRPTPASPTGQIS
jgi:hypothetical protein